MLRPNTQILQMWDIPEGVVTFQVTTEKTLAPARYAELEAVLDECQKWVRKVRKG